MYYIITSPTGLQFKAIVNEYDILIGGSEYNCIDISRNSKNYLNILADERKASCFFNKNFPNNLLDAKELIKASIFILKKIDPKNCYLELTDSSNKNDMSIAYASLFFQLETWYEKYFKASLINTLDIESYRHIKNNLQSTDFKNIIETMYIDLLKRSNTDQEKINILIDIFSNSATLFEFGQNIYKKYENKTKYAYELLKPWLNIFMENLLNSKFIRQNKWIILCENVDTLGFTIKETEPFELKWIAKKKLQIGGNNNKKLTNADKHSYKKPFWLGWKDINLDDFNKEDQEYLKDLLEKFEDSNYDWNK